MPGRQKVKECEREKPLSRPASAAAASFLRARLGAISARPKLGAKEKAALVADVNQILGARGFGDVYTERKLDDWVGNTLYRQRCGQKKKQPESWQAGRRKRQHACGAAAKPAACSAQRPPSPTGPPPQEPEGASRGACEHSADAAAGRAAGDEDLSRAAGIKSFLCPISHEVMRDPVAALDGHSYERANIERWLQEQITSPLTGMRLASRLLIPNHALRASILECANPKAGGGGASVSSPDGNVAYYVQSRQPDTPELPEAPSCARGGQQGDDGAQQQLPPALSPALAEGLADASVLPVLALSPGFYDGLPPLSLSPP